MAEATIQQPPPFPMLNLTQAQKNVISGMLAQVAGMILDIQFNSPEDDHLRIRQHAALFGSMSAFKDILQFDARNAAEFEAKLRENIADTQEGPTLSESGPGF